MKNGKKLRILFNDSHPNLPGSLHIPQGGPERFAQNFTSYFEKHFDNVEFVSLLFSHNQKKEEIFVRKTNGSHHYYEVVYPNTAFHKSYKEDYTKAEYITFLTPWLDRVNEVFEQSNPDMVFLNGFNVSNWLILETAYRRGIPVCIQHAGIAKKELLVSQRQFSPSVRRILCGFEKEIIKKTAHQIFLNEFSRQAFFKLHTTVFDTVLKKKTAIVALPVDIEHCIPVEIPTKHDYHIGMVARWDSIKNHRAMVRFATYVKSCKLPFVIQVVTRWKEGLISNFKDRYEKLIEVVPQMPPEKLRSFFANQDITIVPSKFDVSPTVVMESLLAGKPIIISDGVGWISDYHKFGLDDMIIKQNASGKTIAETIEKLIRYKDKYIPRFQKFQNKIVDEHNPENVFKKYYQIFVTLHHEHTK